MDLKIQDRIVGGKSPTFIIAELSANHAQKYDVAAATIRAAKKSGADAIKFQTYTPDTITIDCNNKYFQIKQGTIWDGRTLYDLYKEAYMPWAWQPKLKRLADSLGLICFSTPFDPTSVDFLEKMNVPGYKIASFEITDIPLIEYVALKGKPIIISTGIANLTDIKAAIRACKRMGNNQIALLKCTSAYPAPAAEANLRTISDISRRFKVIAGLSDHTLGGTVSIAAVALGAKIIEKHFILDRKLGGADSSFSMEPQEFSNMVRAIRDVEDAIGTVNYKLSKKVLKNREFSRSLFAVENIKVGDLFTESNVRSIRPGYGLPPVHINEILGKKALRSIKRGNPLAWGHVKKQ